MQIFCIVITYWEVTLERHRKMSKNYSMKVGELDRERLRILNKYYNPGSLALLKKAGVSDGSSLLEVGCGHGGMLSEISRLVGQDGKIIAIDSNAEQLKQACQKITSNNISFVHQSVYDLTVDESVDFVYCRFLLMHLSDPLLAIRKMLSCLAKAGKLIVEIGDTRTHRYIPNAEITNRWQDYWFKTGKALNASYLFCDEAYKTFRDLGLKIDVFSNNLPVSNDAEAKSLHYLGFKQLVPTYLEKGGADSNSINEELTAYEKCIASPDVYVELYKLVQFVVCKQ